MAHRPSGEAVEQGRGVRVILMLALLTVAEFVVAVVFRDLAVALVTTLTVVAALKAWLIVTYFMHVAKVWRGEEETA